LSLDPLADKFAAWSPYNYVLGNPVRLIDPDGRAPSLANGTGDPPYIYKKIRQAAEYIVNDFIPMAADKTVQGFNAARETRAGQFVEGMANNTLGAFVDVGTSVSFPLINQTGVIINEGVHEGAAYYDENNILPNTYTLDGDWNLVPERMTVGQSEERGKELIKNTVKVLTTVAGGPKETLVERAGTMTAKSVINKATEKLLEVEECSDSCENP